MSNSLLKDKEDDERIATHMTVAVVNCIINAVLMLTSITGNSLVVVSILKTPSLCSPSTVLLFGLAVSDLLVGLVAQPFYIAKELTDDLFIKRACYFFLFNFCGVSLWTMTVISLDRFAALRYHMRYTTLVTSTRVSYALVTMWSIIFLSFCIYFWNKPAYFVLAGCFIVTCLFLASFSYIRIFRIVYRHKIQIHAQQQAVRSFGNTSYINLMRLRKSAMNTFIFYMFLLLFYIPAFILMFLYGILQYWPEWWNISTCTSIFFMNSSINPILYCWRLKELRVAVLKTARKLLRLRTNQD